MRKKNDTPLKSNERKALARIKKLGVLLVSPTRPPSEAILSLAARGLIIPLPGLLPEALPQGYVARDR